MPENDPQTYQIARFALSRSYEDIPKETIDQLKKHLLDTVGSMLHCLHRPVIVKLQRSLKALSSGGNCPVPVLGRLPADRAAQYYTALLRYPDFMDNFLGKEATCHPADNVGALLAAACITGASGKDLLLSIAIAYEIECRLIEEFPVMMKGFDHTLLLAYSVTAGLCRLMGLSVDQTANALGIAGSTYNPLVACRASYTREWKGLMSSAVAAGCMNIVVQVKEGITGPTHIFEGSKGVEKEMGIKLRYNWDEDMFDLIPKCMLKSYNAEVHTQSLVEAVLELRNEHHIDPEQVTRIDATTFLTAYHIVGGGEYGPRDTVFSKEQADHSLPYVLSAALIDGELYPGQFIESRINAPDLQQLLKKVQVHTKFPLHDPKKIAGMLDPYTRAYPDKMMGEVKIVMQDGTTYQCEKEDYYGFHTRPMSWRDVQKKFKRLSEEEADAGLQQELVNLIKKLDRAGAAELVTLMARAGKKQARKKKLAA